MTQRHPDNALVSNPKDTAPPRRRPGQQLPRHGATQTTPCSPILMTLRHPDHALVSNPQDTAPPRGRAAQQSPSHSGAHATRPPAIPMAQRHTRHTRDTPTPIHTACHCVPRRATRRTQPAAAFQETSAPSSHPQIHGFPAPATISQPQTRACTRDLSHRATKTSDFSDRARFTAPATRIHRPVPSRAHQCIRSPTPATRNAGRSRKIMRVCDTPGTQSPRQSAASTPAAHPRHTSQHAQSPQPATRNAR